MHPCSALPTHACIYVQGVQLQSFLDSGHVTVVPPPAPQVRPVSSSSWGTADCSVLQDLTRRLHSAVAQQCSKAAADAARAVGAQQQRVLVVVDSLSVSVIAYQCCAWLARIASGTLASLRLFDTMAAGSDVHGII